MDRSRDEKTDLIGAGIAVQNGGNDLALVLSGGGARAAYQVGLLRCLAKHFPELSIPILTGVSAGAINAAFLANHRGSFAEAVDDLTTVWRRLSLDQVFRVDTWSLTKNVVSWGSRLLFGGGDTDSSVRGFVDTSPLDTLLRKIFADHDGKLSGIGENLRQGRLKALAITGTNYATGQAVTWVQGKNINMWERPHRRSSIAEFSVDHIMASAALPLFFPAIEVDGRWYGDGGIRQSAPLSPALHLGAKRILAISTRFVCPTDEAISPMIHGYPPPAQILGALMNSIFLDVLDQDARALERVNQLLKKIPPGVETGSARVDLFMLRPSSDIGKISSQFESRLPGLFRHLGRSIGTKRTNSPDWLSMVMFEPRYIERMLKIGEADAEAKLEEIAALLGVA